MIKLDEKTIHDNCTEIYKCLSPHSDVYGIRAGSKGRIEGIFWWWGKAWFWIKDLFTCGAQTRKVDEAVKITFENMKGQLETSPYSCFFYVDRRPSFFDILIDGHWGPGDCEDPPGPNRRSYSALTKRMLTSKSFQEQKLEIDRLASEINTIISNGQYLPTYDLELSPEQKENVARDYVKDLEASYTYSEGKGYPELIHLMILKKYGTSQKVSHRIEVLRKEKMLLSREDWYSHEPLRPLPYKDWYSHEPIDNAYVMKEGEDL